MISCEGKKKQGLKSKSKSESEAMQRVSTRIDTVQSEKLYSIQYTDRISMTALRLLLVVEAQLE